ncbi:MAG: leucine-rich repeat domain-containing protein [Eubacterium sp.]|nr:leucine-rich repeat domain-containing protein [Eubacterium sp.]
MKRNTVKKIALVLAANLALTCAINDGPFFKTTNGSLNATVAQAESFTGELPNAADFTADYVNGIYTITGYKGVPNQDFIVPAIIGGIEVKAIGADAMANLAGVVRVYLPDTLEYIGDRAFYGCSLQAIGSYTYTAPSNTDALVETATIESPESLSITPVSGIETSINLPSHLVEIGTSAFEATSLNINLVAVNSQMKSIGNRAFANSRNLQAFAILPGANVERIGNNAFTDNNLHEFHIYGKVGTICSKAFENVPNLTNFVVEDKGSVNALESYAFTGSCNLHYVTLRGVSNVGSYAFAECGNMENVYISSNSGYTLGAFAFKNTAIHNVNLDTGLKSVEKGTFEDCKNIVKVHLPDSVTYVADDAFKNVTTLQELTLNDNAVVAPNAFAGASGTTLNTLRSTSNKSILYSLGGSNKSSNSSMGTLTKVKLSKLKINKKKKTAKLTWSTNTAASGYVVYRKQVKIVKNKKKQKKLNKKAKFKKLKTVKAPTTRLTVKLKKKTTTTFYVKAYVKLQVSNKTNMIYSKASNKKSVKLKK